MSTLKLTAETGRSQGTRSSRRLRRENKIPGVVYGRGGAPIAISLDRRELRNALSTDAGLNALLMLDIDGDSELTIVTELQRHPVRREMIHIDLLRIDANVSIEVEVPVVLVGEARDVTNNNGMVDQVMHEMTVLVRPNDIPTEITVDITDLKVGESLRITDVILPPGAEAVGDPEDAVAVGVITRSTIEAIAEEDAAEAADALEEAEAADGGDSADGDDSADSDSDS